MRGPRRTADALEQRCHLGSLQASILLVFAACGHAGRKRIAE
jgi:hypothetical protein